MARPDGTDRPSVVSHWLPYGLVGIGLLGGLAGLLFRPLPWPVANVVVGWVAIVVAIGSVYYLVALGGGPGERGPDF